MNDKYKGYTNAEKALQMIIDLTGDLGGGNSLSEKLQRLLDLPCELCNDGEIIKEQQSKIVRLSRLLYNSIVLLENQTGESIIDTDLEDEIGITREEYDEVKATPKDNALNTKYDRHRFIYKVAINCQEGGKEFYEEHSPDSQSWEDIIAKYNSEKENLVEEIKDKIDDDETSEWTLNGYQPITRFECTNGDWYEIYVCACEK